MLLVAGFITFRQSRAYPLVSVFMLSYAIQLLSVTLYLMVKLWEFCQLFIQLCCFKMMFLYSQKKIHSTSLEPSSYCWPPTQLCLFIPHLFSLVPSYLSAFKSLMHFVLQVTSLAGFYSSRVRNERPFQSANPVWCCHAEQHRSVGEGVRQVALV